jgi:hypothetical protein
MAPCPPRVSRPAKVPSCRERTAALATPHSSTPEDGRSLRPVGTPERGVRRTGAHRMACLFQRPTRQKALHSPRDLTSDGEPAVDRTNAREFAADNVDREPGAIQYKRLRRETPQGEPVYLLRTTPLFSSSLATGMYFPIDLWDLYMRAPKKAFLGEDEYRVDIRTTGHPRRARRCRCNVSRTWSRIGLRRSLYRTRRPRARAKRRTGRPAKGAPDGPTSFGPLLPAILH